MSDRSPALALLSLLLAACGGNEAAPLATAPAVTETHVIRPRLRPGELDFGDRTETIWCGMIANDQPYYYVWGDWTVPRIVPDGTGAGQEYTASWVGVGGADGSTLVQAGVSTRAGFGNGVPTAFAEVWMPGIHERPAMLDLPLAEGDSISVAVAVTELGDGGSGHASFYITNNTQHLAAPAELDVPAGFTGSSAEWIVETPCLDGNLYLQPNFGSVEFSAAGTWSEDGGWIGYDNGDYDRVTLAWGDTTMCTARETGGGSLAMDYRSSGTVDLATSLSDSACH